MAKNLQLTEVLSIIALGVGISIYGRVAASIRRVCVNKTNYYTGVKHLKINVFNLNLLKPHIKH